MIPLPSWLIEENVSVPGFGSWPLLHEGGDFECLIVFLCVGSINACGLVETVVKLLGGYLSEEGSLQENRVNKWLAAGKRGKLTSHARFLTPPPSPGASEDLDSSNASSMPTTRS